MPRTILFAAALLAAAAVAAALRLPDVGNRTMHCDEANQAVKFAGLLERGEYRYDPHEHHGPTLLYATLPVAWAASAETLAELNEVHLRLVTALAGILLVALAWLARDTLGPAATLFAALLTAVSPAMVFYSRYYIMEMLLVTFTFAGMVALWRYWRANRNAAAAGRAGKGATNGRGFITGIGWLVLLGVSIGLMHATKETCIIAVGAMGVGAAVGMPGLWRLGAARIGLAAVVVVLVAAAVSALFFSSFFEHPGGVVDSYTALGNYIGRAAGEGSAGPQVKPWDYYLRILYWRGEGSAPGEMIIGALALIGLVAAAIGRGMKPEHLPAARFAAVYTVLMTAVYSAMPYKTPWSALGMLHGAILLAGVGAAALWRFAPGRLLKGAVVLVLLADAGHLAWSAYRTSFAFHEDPATNPYVHTPTAQSALRLARRVREIAAVHPDGLAMHVQVVCPDADYWPLPWYLRAMKRVAWHSKVPKGRAAPLIIARPELTAAIVKFAYEEQPEGERHLISPFPPESGADWLLRTNVPLEVFIRRELLDTFTDKLTKTPTIPLRWMMCGSGNSDMGRSPRALSPCSSFLQRVPTHARQIPPPRCSS